MAANGRYKSRALNYLVEQAQKFKSQAARTFRHAKTGMTWGAQILIYPLYVAFQASRVVGKRLTSASAPQEVLKLPEYPKSDEPLARVLSLAQGLVDGDSVAVASEATAALEAESAVESTAEQSPIESLVERQPVTPEELEALRSPAPLPTASEADLSPQADLWEMTDDSEESLAITPQASVELLSQRPTVSTQADSPQPGIANTDTTADTLATQTSATPRSNAYFIRGIASDLNNRALTLVDNQNNLVPLSAEQQQQVKQHMVQEVADFAYRRRRYLKLLFERQRPLAPAESDRPTLLPPVRWTRNLMGWMQRSPVAKAVNLFNETQLPPTKVLPPSVPALARATDWATQFLVTSDQSLAKVALARMDASLVQLETQLDAQLNAQLNTTNEQVPPNALGQLIRRAAAFFGLVPRPTVLETTGLETIGLETTGLDTPGLETTARDSQASALNQASASNQGKISGSATSSEGTATQGTVAAASGPTIQIQQLDWNTEGAIAPTTPASVVPGQSTTQPVSPSPSAIAATTPTAAQPSNAASAASPADSTGPADPADPTALATGNESSESSPQWIPSYIETTATVTGYIKHPLEWLLEKLDRLLVRIEQWVERIWQWFQAQFQPNR